MRYTVNLSLTDGFNNFLKRLLNEKIKPMIEILVENMHKIDDERLRAAFNMLISEYQRLHLLISVFSKMLDDVKAGRMSEEDLKRLINSP